MKFHWDILPPAMVIGGSYGIGFVAWSFGSTILFWLNPVLKEAVASSPPAGVTGTDIIANLLTISALVISGCFVYICLPRDRVELRIAHHVRTSFEKHSVDEVVFLEYCAKTTHGDQSQYCQICNAFLSPLTGLGGWKGMPPDALVSVFGKGDTKKIRRVVDQHIDAQWLIMLSGTLGIAMCVGAACLFMRYVALDLKFYNATEFACICTLACLSAGTVLVALWLVFVSNGAERIVCHMLATMSKDIKITINTYTMSKMDRKLDNIGGQTI